MIEINMNSKIYIEYFGVNSYEIVINIRGKNLSYEGWYYRDKQCLMLFLDTTNKVCIKLSASEIEQIKTEYEEKIKEAIYFNDEISYEAAIKEAKKMGRLVRYKWCDVGNRKIVNYYTDSEGRIYCKKNSK